MSSPADLVALRQWLSANAGYLSSDITITYNEVSGVHYRANRPLAAGTRLCAVPHSLALSSLNALVDDAFPPFRNRGLAVQAIGYFYLMHQYITKADSFWRPYLQTLPAPDAEHSTPFWFNDDELQVLADTDVYQTTMARMEIHRGQYDEGIKLLEKAHIDTTQYTWHLFKWAVTMFTSRSFNSTALRPQESKYWTAYKTSAEGRRQAVLMDMSRVSAEQLDFPVLFPMIDIPNHQNHAKVDWAFDPGRFSLTLAETVQESAEVFNNYGPKSNDELLLGYGFCLPENPNDKVLLTLKSPPPALQEDLWKVLPGYFNHDRTWAGDKATFGLMAPTDHNSNAESVFQSLPEPLLELLLYMLRHERALPFYFIESPRVYLANIDGVGHRYQVPLVRAIVESLVPKLAKLQSTTPPVKSENKRTHFARMYREGQINILNAIVENLRRFLRLRFRPENEQVLNGPRPMLLTLEDLLQALALVDNGRNAKVFLQGIAANAGTDDIEELRQAGWEEDVLVVLICFLALKGWTEKVPAEYINNSAESASGQSFQPAITESDLQQAQSVLDIVNIAAAQSEDPIWHDQRWSAWFIAGYAGRMLKYDSFLMMVPNDKITLSKTAKVVVYMSGLAHQE